ncbi:NAD(P)-binding protein [Annulohypoxylon maeteangense]|uniref:NAD(P)-binding protein n=1 Tax=Annulohypoxylon maeteangense TaxID=1927788 RepID=UPI00200764A0|nr:NAD(P)-binding protein [Annulohypoxylon maeteangense]KAI0883738.1 NAD(P)-binding protein [Annulohypoxylon maeteangense]
MAPKIILISGAARGLGKGLVERYLAQPNHLVIAANRNPGSPASQTLSQLPVAEGSRLVVVKLDATVDTDAADAVKELREKHVIEHLDVVIANAGISSVWPAVKDVRIEDLDAHMRVNVYGVVTLYQATREMLRKAKGEPVFAPMGSSAGFITGQLPITNAAYGPSKAALHWFVVRINAEDEWLNAFALSPGWVQTELGNNGARGLGLEMAPVGLEESVDGMVKMLSRTSKEKHGGKTVAYDGDVSNLK